ncbi:MAG TPA: Obg family GTPase CgtA, partial [Vicinamibacterales bacterium]
AHANLNTLLNFRFQKIFEAGNGAGGEGSNRSGKTGADITLQVPIGTQVFEPNVDDPMAYTLVADLTDDGQTLVIAKGGLGGQGNARYATSTNRAPRRTQPGLPGDERDLRLQLKLLADVGLVGYPNAGKSTIISRISAAKPKIAAYPFTTLVPNLGVVGLSGDRSFVVADVPGLIAGAHEGHGLGHRFLSHLERTRVLVHVIDVSSTEGRDPIEDFNVITRELALFPGRDAAGERLQDKPIVVAANKTDALDDPERLERLREHLQAAGVPLYAVSAVTGEGLPLLLEAVWKKLAAHEARGASREAREGAKPPHLAPRASHLEHE